MTFKQWVRDMFGPEARAARASRPGKSPRRLKREFKPRVESLEDRRLLAVLTVNSLQDGTLGSLAGDGKLQLREAIELASHPGTIDGVTTDFQDFNDSTIQFDPSLDGQTIKLNTRINELVPPINEETALGPSAFVLRDVNLTIDGQSGLAKGITIARDSTASPFRLFFVASGTQLTLKSLTLSGGKAQGFDGASGGGAGGGGAAGLGGAVFNHGQVTILGSTLTGNTAQGGNGAAGGKVNGGGGGGGLGQAGSPGKIVLDSQPGSNDGMFGRGGDAGGPNGGDGGTVPSPFGTADNGTPGGFGGGGGGGYGFGGFQSGFIPFYGNGGNGGFGGGGGGGGSGDIGDYTGGPGGNGGFGGGGGGGGNSAYGGAGGGFGGGTGLGNNGGGGAGMGGAIFNYLGRVTITNSTLEGNNALRGNAGNNLPTVNAKGLGGGVFNFDGVVSVASSTVAENYALDGGGGIYSMDNGAGSPLATVFLNNSIIANSYLSTDHTLASSSDLKVLVNGGAVKVAGGWNLIGAGDIPTTGDVTNTLSDTVTGDPKLKPLQFNGGLTNTMALQPGSPAIDASNSDTTGTGIVAPFADQRGFSPRVGRADIGAIEFGAKGQQTINFAALANKTYGDTDFTISASATSRSPVSFSAAGNASVYQDAGGAWRVHIIATGSATITAHQAGDENYFAAPDATQNLTIEKATATVVVTPYTVIYDGLPHMAVVASIVGVNGETGPTVGTVDVTGTTHTIAGFYNDFWSFKGTANYRDICNTSITDTIALALSNLPNNLTVNAPYTMMVTAAGHPGPTTFSLASGTLPTGITLNSNGTFRGAPTTIGQFTFTIAATNGAVASGIRTYTTNVNAPIAVGNLTVTQWTARHAGFDGKMTIANGAAAYAIVGAPKGLPPGLTAVLSGNTIGFTGTPIKAGTFAGSITIKDLSGFQVTKKFTIKINPPLTFTPPQQTLVYIPGKSYSQTFKTAGGTGARTVTYTLSDPLPAGLTISPPSPTTGGITVSGKTSVKTRVKITLTVTDAIGTQTTVTYTLQPPK